MRYLMLALVMFALGAYSQTVKPKTLTVTFYNERREVVAEIARILMGPNKPSTVDIEAAEHVTIIVSTEPAPVKEK